MDFQHQPTYQPVAKLGLAFVGMSRCTDFARQAFRNLPGFGEFRKVLQDVMHGWHSKFEERMDSPLLGQVCLREVWSLQVFTNCISFCDMFGHVGRTDVPLWPE